MFRSEIGESPRWIDVIPKKVTLTKLHPLIFANKTNGEDISPFKEVQTVPFYEAATEETLDFMRTRFERHAIPEKKFAYRLYQAVYDSIRANWDSEKFHVVSISSGFDTRLIALIISRLRENNGDEWIGNLVFYEIGEEGGESRKVLEHLELDNYPF